MAYIHSFRVAHQDDSFSKINETEVKPILVDLLDAIFNGKTVRPIKCIISQRKSIMETTEHH